jgi:hypothetical protein
MDVGDDDDDVAAVVVAFAVVVSDVRGCCVGEDAADADTAVVEFMGSGGKDDANAGGGGMLVLTERLVKDTALLAFGPTVCDGDSIDAGGSI